MAVTLDEVRKAITAMGANWEAAETPFTGELRNIELPARMLGLVIDEEEEEELLKAASNVVRIQQPAPTAAYDWRGHPGKLSPIRNQRTCGSCVAFATCGTMEASYLIGLGAAGAIDLSEAHVFACAGGKCASGMSITTALEFARTNGVGLEKDFPYQPADQACRQITPALKIHRYQAYANLGDRKRAICNRPVLASMTVYEDLFWYKGGVYSNVKGAYKGEHAVVVVGYSDAEGCWIVRNSWGTGFGLEGYFKIAYGQCNIDTRAFYDVEVTAVGPTS